MVDRMKHNTALWFFFLLVISACNKKKLPVYGDKTAVVKLENGKQVTDSIDYIIPPFSFLNQDSQWINATNLRGKILVAEFFFTACPSICPKMQQQMLRVHEKYKNNKDVVILAFTIDPVRDSVPRLHAYASKLGVLNTSWNFMTGDKDSIYALADNFLVSAAEDPDAPGGHVHSGNFILVDKQKRLRGYYDGVNEKSVDKLLTELDILLQEE